MVSVAESDPLEALEPSAIEAAVVQRSPGAWFEMHGAIYDKERNIHRAPELELNTMQQRLDEIVVWCEENGVPCRIVTLKGRQQGSSTWSVGAMYHQLRKKTRKACIIGDQYERSVANLVAMFDLFAAEDRYNWGSTYYAPGKSFTNGSLLVTETANSPRAGASGTFQCVLCTETAHWKEAGGGGGTKISAKATFAALMNCVPRKPGTLVIVESTPNGAGGVYYDTYMGAATFDQVRSGKTPAGWNGFIKVFYPWHEHPEYRKDLSPEEAEAIMDSLSERERELVADHQLGADRLAWRREMISSVAFAGNEEVFEQEYPSDETRCFLLSGRRAFPLTALQAMKKKAEREGPGRLKHGVLQWLPGGETRAALRLADEDESWIKVWEDPKPGCRYVVSIDPATGQAHGDDPDNHGVGVIRDGYFDGLGRWNPPALVARLSDVFLEKRERKGRAACKWDIALLEDRVAKLSAWYGWAIVVPEINMDRGLVELLRLRPRARIFQRIITNRVEQTESRELGWATTSKTRGAILEGLKRRIRTWEEQGAGIMIWDPVVISECESMVVLDNGREEAMAGAHDDQVFMMAIGMEALPSGLIMPYPVRQGDSDHGSPPRDMTYC